MQVSGDISDGPPHDSAPHNATQHKPEPHTFVRRSTQAHAPPTHAHHVWHAGQTALDAVSRVPPGRWDMEVGDELVATVMYGAFFWRVDVFDHRSFGLPPAEADIMDPHQRMALEDGYCALHSAGFQRGTLMDSVTGVFGGIWASDYTAVLSKRGAAGRGPFAVAATGCAMLVGRLSYVLGMQGPSIAFDTACSSSLSAFQAALHSHKQQECDAALVLGVNIMCDVGMSQHFAAARMCSPTGRSHTFDALADGYARGEACCGAALVPRAGVQLIRCDAGAVRQDGRSASLTAPNGTAQQALIRAALQSAGRAARGAFILESHGTGTTLGDPIESRAMCAVRDEPELMQVTGCKANFGHTEPAAGVTGLLRAGMALLWSVASPNAQLRVMNPHVRAAVEGRPSLPIQGELSQSSPAGGARVGEVSSFGLNGTIAHAVLSSSPEAWTGGVLLSGGGDLGSVRLGLPVQRASLSTAEAWVGGVSSFGYAGTIAHTVLSMSHALGMVAPSWTTVQYRRCAFFWRDSPHPLAQ